MVVVVVGAKVVGTVAGVETFPKAGSEVGAGGVVVDVQESKLGQRMSKTPWGSTSSETRQAPSHWCRPPSSLRGALWLRRR